MTHKEPAFLEWWLTSRIYVLKSGVICQVYTPDGIKSGEHHLGSFQYLLGN